jgi:ribosomal protein L23
MPTNDMPSEKDRKTDGKLGDLLKSERESKEKKEPKFDVHSQQNLQYSGNSSASGFGDEEDGENDQPKTEHGQEDEEDVEPEVKTVDNLEEALKDLVNQDGRENVYVEIPKLNMNRIIVNNIEIHNRCKESWASYLDTNVYESGQIFGVADKEFREFKRSAQKEVNYLVKEFECRKAADSYARATTARTGVLDCTKLHTYKYNEDLFRKVTTLADGKNHGLVFILDWSGSMNDVMLDTVKQLFNLIWFCKKVSIPFEVYAFTNEYPKHGYDENHKAIVREPAYQKKAGFIHIHESFSLMNMLTSKVNNSTLENQMLNIYRVASGFIGKHYSQYYTPVGWSLSGTPLNESLIALHEILPTFQKENKLQKVQCVVLTDGEAGHLKYHKEFNRPYEKEPYIGLNAILDNSFLRDRKTGNTYSLNYDLTKVLLQNLRDNFPTVNFIGMRILQSRDAGSFVRRYTGWVSKDYEKIMNTWKKEKSFSIKNSGYHTYFGLSDSTLSNDVEFEVAEDATKSQIKSAFIKSLKSKKMNKKVLGEFVELIA